MKIIWTPRTKQEIDYFIAGPGMEAAGAASIETTRKIQRNIAVYLKELSALMRQQAMSGAPKMFGICTTKTF